MGVSFFLLREAKRGLAYRIPAFRLVMFIDFFNLEASAILLFHYLASIIFLSYSERTWQIVQSFQSIERLALRNNLENLYPPHLLIASLFTQECSPYSLAKAVAAQVQRCKWKKAWENSYTQVSISLFQSIWPLRTTSGKQKFEILRRSDVDPTFTAYLAQIEYLCSEIPYRRWDGNRYIIISIRLLGVRDSKLLLGSEFLGGLFKGRIYYAVSIFCPYSTA